MVQSVLMKKTEAIQLLGGSVKEAATTLGVTYQAVEKWPEELPPRIADRVLGARVRKSMPELVSQLADPAPTTAQEPQPAQGVSHV